VEATPEGRPARSPAELAFSRSSNGNVSGRLLWTDEEGSEVSVDVQGTLIDGCRLRLEGRAAGRRAMTAMLSRDGRSLYASWDEPAGYLVVRR
jgi:hypothetical protein